MTQYFNTVGFYWAFDAERKRRGLSWDQVAEKTGLSRSTIYRMQKGQNIYIENLAIASVWSGISLQNYIPSVDGSELNSIAKIIDIIYGDPKLSDEAKNCLAIMMKTAYESLIYSA